MTRFICFLSISAAIAIVTTNAQSPKPMVVQAATAATPASAPVAKVQNTNNSISAALQSLQQTRAANYETLKKQEAVLEQLDQAQKAAEQLKIFAHRSGG